jgi:MoaA/NifB/PqqE/SkfB family radical SAM enzyme
MAYPPKAPSWLIDSHGIRVIVEGTMRTQRVLTHRRCNQNCTYCTARRPTDDLAHIQASAVRGRIDAAIATGATEIVMTGGEPTLRRDLEDLVSYARGKAGDSPRSVAIETNATLVDDARSRTLREAGLDLALVNLAGTTAGLDAVTRDPGGFDATLRGIRALVGAGVPVEVTAAVVCSTRAGLPGLPTLARAAGARGIRLVVPVESPDPSELLDWREAAETVLRVESAARHAGVTLRFEDDVSIAPCAFPQSARVAHLYASLTRGAARRDGYEAIEACVACLMNETCPGVSKRYLALHGTPAVEPIAVERTRRRLTLMTSVEEQMRREFITPNRVAGDGGVVEEEVIRVNFHCNQSCDFCFVSTHLPAMGDDLVRAAIVDAGRRGAEIVLSGGEPTLNPHLAEYVALAKAHSERRVQLQTNAVRLDDASLVRTLVDAGLNHAFVSLHGSTADISDRVTGAPGTFDRTVVGIDNLVAASVATVLNFVLCQTNYRDFPGFVRLATTRWPAARLNVSFVAPSADVVARDHALVPRYSDVLPFVATGVELALEARVQVLGFESMCGLPLCLVPPSVLERIDAPEIPAGFDRGEFVKANACRSCRLGGRCHGVRRGYADLYGTDELRALPPS